MKANFLNYYVYPNGQIFSIKSKKFIKQHNDGNGYLIVKLRQNNQSINFKVHRLVAMIYLDNSNNLPQVNHKDGFKLNNHWTNLEWISGSDNMKHAYDKGLMKKNRQKCVLDLQTGIYYDSIKEVAFAKNINHNTMRALILNKKTSIIHI